jgi:Sporulation and spore germination
VTRPLAVTVTLVAFAFTAACGVTTQDQPRTIDRKDVPFGLADEANSSSNSPRGATRSINVYFVGPSGLVPIPRAVSSASTEQALAELRQGPTTAQAQGGLRTAVVGGGDTEVSVNGDVATVRLDPGFLGLSRTEQTWAIAQLVFTLADLQNVARVRFQVGEESLSVPARGGQSTSAPIGPADVRLPEVPTATT